MKCNSLPSGFKQEEESGTVIKTCAIGQWSKARKNCLTGYDGSSHVTAISHFEIQTLSQIYRGDRHERLDRNFNSQSMKILSSKPRRDGQETKGSTRDLRATEPWFNSPHLASSCLVIWQYGNIFEAQLHHIHPFSSWMGCHFELYFISSLWIPVIWSGVPGNKSTWIIPGLFKPGYILMYFAVSLTKQLCLQHG